MEDQGIMALPQGQAMQGPTAQPAAPEVDPAAMAAFEQARMQIDPKEFGDALLSEASNIDPAAVQQFMSVLQGINLPPEIIDALGQMVDMILAEPQNYPQIRQALISAGVPEELLPPEFDPAYFAAMNMALDQLSANVAPQPQGFAQGGIASLTPIASEIARMGRNGDTMLAHITPSEARLLRRRGGSGTVNPVTGLPEFFSLSDVGRAFKDVGRSVSNTLRSIGRGIKKFANSTVGRIITTVALGFFLGPAAASMLGVTSAAGVAAVSGFVGGFGSSLLGGQNLRTALKTGAIGALTAGAASGISGGAAAFQSAGAPTLTPGEALSQQFQKFTGGLESLRGGVTPTTEAAPSLDTAQMARADVPTPENAFRTIEYPTGQGPMTGSPGNVQLASVQGPTMTDARPGLTMNDLVSQYEGSSRGVGLTPVEAQPGGFYGNTPTTTFDSTSQNVFRLSVDESGNVLPAETSRGDIIDRYGRRMAGTTVAPQESTLGRLRSPVASPAEATTRLGEAFYPTPEAAVSKFRVPMTGPLPDYFPATASRAAVPGMGEGIMSAAKNIYGGEYMKAASDLGNVFFGTTPRTIGTGLALTSMLSRPKQPPPPGIVPKETGYDLLRRNPEIYGVTPGGGYLIYGNPYTYPQRMAQGGIAAMAPRRYALGGYASGGTSRFPRRTGQINGPGTETSDSIPAMLSDGEFVMTAKAVRGAGKGSRREGAKKMYAMMKALERKSNG